MMKKKNKAHLTSPRGTKWGGQDLLIMGEKNEIHKEDILLNETFRKRVTKMDQNKASV